MVEIISKQALVNNLGNAGFDQMNECVKRWQTDKVTLVRKNMSTTTQTIVTFKCHPRMTFSHHQSAL